MPKAFDQPIILTASTHRPAEHNRAGLDLQGAYTALITAYEHTLRRNRAAASPMPTRSRREK